MELGRPGIIPINHQKEQRLVQKKCPPFKAGISLKTNQNKVVGQKRCPLDRALNIIKVFFNLTEKLIIFLLNENVLNLFEHVLNGSPRQFF